MKVHNPRKEIAATYTQALQSGNTCAYLFYSKLTFLGRGTHPSVLGGGWGSPGSLLKNSPGSSLGSIWDTGIERGSATCKANATTTVRLIELLVNFYKVFPTCPTWVFSPR